MTATFGVLWRVRNFFASFFRLEPRLAEIWSALAALTWVALSWLSVDDLSRWPSMAVLLQIGPDEFWHTLGATLGLLQLGLLRFHCHTVKWLRWGVTLMMCWFWGLLTVGVWAATPWNPATAAYAGWCGINAFSIVRIFWQRG
jgi:hypothetical protein